MSLFTSMLVLSIYIGNDSLKVKELSIDSIFSLYSLSVPMSLTQAWAQEIFLFYLVLSFLSIPPVDALPFGI